MRLATVSDSSVAVLNGNSRLDEFAFEDGEYVPPPGVYRELVDNGDGTYTWVDKDSTLYDFDTDGKLASITDRNGNQLTFGYDAGGLLPIIGYSEYMNPSGETIVGYDYMLTSITDAVGRSVSLHYNTEGRLDSLVDFTGRAWHYGYVRKGDLTLWWTSRAGRGTTGMMAMTILYL
jgi:YD repeat-containing protein